MQQPDSSRSRAMHEQWSEPGAGWPVDPAAPRCKPPRSGRPSRRRDYVEDCRHAADLDGNEALERQKIEAAAPSSRLPSQQLAGMPNPFGMDEVNLTELEGDEGWVASRPFTPEDELEDTWPNLPTRPLDD